MNNAKYRITYSFADQGRTLSYERAMQYLAHGDPEIAKRDRASLSALLPGSTFTDSDGDVWERLS